MSPWAWRLLTCLLCIVGAVGFASWEGGPSSADGWLLDRLLALRAVVWPAAPVTEPAPVVVIVLDQRSLAAPALASQPRALLTPVWATLVESVFASGARAIGFDFLFAYSANRFVPNFDRSFLHTLGTYRERLVLGRSARTLPAAPFLAALRQDATHLGLVELTPDRDGHYRHIRPRYQTPDGTTLTGFAQALLQRAQAPAMPATVLLTPRQHLETAIPTYAMVDVLHCAQQAPEALRAAFTGAIVLIGSALAEEDRWVSSGRFLPPATTPGPALHSCGLRRLGASVPEQDTVPGVFLHAAAVDAVVRGSLTTTLPLPVHRALTGGAALLGTLVGLSLTPWLAVAMLGITVLLWLAGAVFLLQQHFWLPLVQPGVGLLMAAALAYVARYLAEERQHRQLRHAFGHFLAPAMVARLGRESAALQLGGEPRHVTVMFADLSGFTKMCTQPDITAQQLVHLTNRYLGYIVAAVEATGGYVDKFIGDEVMALWGAPASDPEHARHSVQAALAVVARLHQAQQEAASRQQPAFGVKIGLNAGSAMVGNVGTTGRYNYTAVGDTVNVAKRLESLCDFYACRIILGEAIAALVQHVFVLCELDMVRVKGRATPIRIFTPLAPQAVATAEAYAYAHAYALALAQYRAGQFAEAAARWEAMPSLWPEASPTPTPPRHPATVLARRARDYRQHPPQDTWDGVWDVTSTDV